MPPGTPVKHQVVSDSPDDHRVGFGRVLPFIDRSRGVEVSEEQGLLVVEFDGEGAAPTVRVGTEDLGPAPTAVALPEGRCAACLRRPDTEWIGSRP